MYLNGGHTSFENKSPKSGVIQVVYVAICLPPAEVVPHVLIRGVDDCPPVECRWILWARCGEVITPEVNKGGGEEGADIS